MYIRYDDKIHTYSTIFKYVSSVLFPFSAVSMSLGRIWGEL